MSKTAKKILIILSSIIIVLSILFIVSLNVIHNKFSYSIIENGLNNFTGLNFELIEPKTTFNPNLSINAKARYINIYNKEKNNKFISIENPNVTFKPLGFLFKKANFKKITVDNIFVNIKRNKDGKIDLLQAIKSRDWSFLKNQKLTITRLNSNIDLIEINFEDNFKAKSNTKISLKDNIVKISKKEKTLSISQHGDIKTNINNDNQNVDISVDIKSKYPVNNISSKDTNLDIKLNNIDISMFESLAKKYISKDIASTQGKINLLIQTTESDSNKNHVLVFRVTSPILKLNNGKIINPYNEINGNMNFSFNKSDVDIINSKISSNELEIGAKGKIIRPFSKRPEIDIETKLTNTQINNFLYFIPDNLIFYRAQGIPNLKKTNIHGVLNGVLQTKYSPLNVTGSLKVSNIFIPNYPKPYAQNDLNAIFMKDKVRIHTRIHTPKINEYVIVDGISSLDTSLWGKYSVKSTNNIDLNFAQMYLVPIQQVIGFNIGPVPIMEISGFGNIDIKTKGTLEDAEIFGRFEARNAKASIQGLSAKLTDGTCKLTFNDRDLIFDYVKGKIDGADFILTGKGNTKGDVDLNTKIKNAKTSNMIKILKGSLVAKPYLKYLNLVAASSGTLETNINMTGTIKDYENPDFLGNLLLSGHLNFKNNKIILNNKLKADKITGTLDFGQKQNGFFELYLNNSKVNINFDSSTPFEKITKGNDFDFRSTIYSNKINFNDILAQIKDITTDKNVKNIINTLNNINFCAKFNIESRGKLSLNKVDLKNIKNKGYVIGINNESSKNIRFNSGQIRIDNDRLVFDNFDTSFLSGKIKAKGSINNILSAKPQGDLNIDLSNLKIEDIEKIIPNLKLKNMILKTGNIVFKNNDIKASSINIDYQSMPIFLSANIKDIYRTKIATADFSTLLNEKTTDNIINPYLTYPVKIKGEIPIKGGFRGNNENYSLDFSATIPKDSDIYYSGANLGDANLKREVTGRIDVRYNSININNLRLIKYITNQNNRTNPLITLRANGQAVQKKDGLYYNNLRISTTTPINVRVLNLIFKKSLLKKGNFECNINLNGNVKTPKITGSASFQDLDIPLYDTQINNIKFNITDKFINGEILAKNKQSDVKLLVKALNKLQSPYIIDKLDISSNKINIADFLTYLVPQPSKSDISKQDIIIKPQDIIVKNGTFEFKDVAYEKINAQNLKGNFDYSNNIFNLKNIALDIAQGRIIANGKYSLNSTRLDLSAKMENCDSNILTKDFLKLPDQMFGRLNGSLILSAKNLNTPQGIKTLKSDVEFSVNEGKMPKLGSLEYLLRAGNLIKSGVLGLSLNNLIQILTPYRTGEFEKISGTMSIGSGEVEKLEIFSKGKNLSLYFVGSYSILENFADINIYGKLSQNISNALGALGNASLRQFFSIITPKKNKEEKDNEMIEKFGKIPSIEIENPEPRYFKVKVLGDINKDNYIKDFSWK